MVGIFNSQIFNNAIFNTAEILPTPSGGLSGGRSRLKNLKQTHKLPKQFRRNERITLQVPFNVRFLVTKRNEMPITIKIFRKRSFDFIFKTKFIIRKQLDELFNQKMMVTKTNSTPQFISRFKILLDKLRSVNFIVIENLDKRRFVTALALGMLVDDEEIMGGAGEDKPIDKIPENDLPLIKRTKTTKQSLRADNKFERMLDSLGKAFLVRGKKLSLDEKKKLYKLFYAHTLKSFTLGRDYSNRVTKQNNKLTTFELNRIDKLTKESLVIWISKIEELV